MQVLSCMVKYVSGNFDSNHTIFGKCDKQTICVLNLCVVSQFSNALRGFDPRRLGEEKCMFLIRQGTVLVTWEYVRKSKRMGPAILLSWFFPLDVKDMLFHRTHGSYHFLPAVWDG